MTFEVRNGCFGYKKTVPILKNISFCVESRQVLAVLGPNGVGKTTLLRSMMGMLPWTSGGRWRMYRRQNPSPSPSQWRK